MTPYLGQGGCQALEDAVTLGECLRPLADIRSGLQAYERIRIPRANMFVRRSRAAGRVAQLEHPLGVSIRNSMIRLVSPRRQTAQIIRMIADGEER